MGQSTNAILAYGKKLSDLNLGGEDFEELNDRIRKNYGCEIVVHCSDSHPMYFLAIASTVQQAYRGNPVQILPEDLKVMRNWDKKIEKALAEVRVIDHLGEENPLESEGNIGWHIMSWWC